MAGYIGTIPVPQATESRSVFTATSNQTTFATGGYTPNLVSVFLNGVHLARADFVATNGTDVVLAVGAAADDTVEILAFNAFEASSSAFTADVSTSGTFLPEGDTAAGDDAAVGYTAAEGLILTGQGSTSDITLKNDADATVFTVPTGTDDILFPDGAKAMFGAGSDLQIFHDGTHSRIDNNEGDLFIQSDTIVRITNSAADETAAKFFQDGAVELYHNNAKKLNTTATGITVTGAIATSAGGVALTSLDIDGGTDIGAALVDADLMIVDDGAGGTNRKATMTRLATYMGTKIGGGMEFIASSGELSSAASASFTGFDSSKYDNYMFYLNYVKPATDNVVFFAHASTNGGSGYDTTNGNYHMNGAVDTTGFNFNHQIPAGNDTNEFGLSGTFLVKKPHASAYTSAHSEVSVRYTNGIHYNGSSTANYENSEYLSTSEVNAIQFKFASGNIASGEITMFGIVNS